LRLGLQEKILGRAAAQDEHAAAAAVLFRLIDDRGRLIHVTQWVDPQLRAFELQRRQVHANGAVVRGRSENRRAAAMGGGAEAAMFAADFVLTSRQVFADEIVKLRGAEGSLKGVAAAQGAI